MASPLAWLQKQIPVWQSEGFITAQQGERILAYYAGRRAEGSRNIALILFGILGALLIGGGVLLIIAHNWAELGRGFRTILSVTPLILCQAGSAWVLHRRADSTAWREGWGLGWTISIAAAIALVAQTYHMPGSFDSFMLTWMSLTLPVLYVMQSTTTLLVYLAGVTTWGLNQYNETSITIGFWFLLAAALPVVIAWARRRPFGGPSTIARWAYLAAVSLGLMFQHRYGSFFEWMLIHSFYAAVVFLYGCVREDRAPSAWQKPATALGGLAMGILVYALTWVGFWEEVGRFRRNWRIDEAFTAPYLSLLAVMVILYGVLLARSLFTRRWLVAAWSAAPVLFSIGLLFHDELRSLFPVAWLMNAFALAVGLFTLWSGISESRLTKVNTGMMLVSALILSRFFDERFSILTRAVVFIALGVAFLMVNFRMARRKRRAAS